MDKGNCRGLLIGHHSALSSPSITQRALPSPTPRPSITSHVWAYRGVLSSCRRPIPLGLQGFPVAYALGTREVGSAPLSLTVHHRVTGEGERSSAWRWARKPGAQRCDWLPAWQMLASYAKEEGKEKPPWGPSAPRAGGPGPPRAPAGWGAVWIINGADGGQLLTRACICALVLSRDESQSRRGFTTSGLSSFFTRGETETLWVTCCRSHAR